jgi:hypothetical protein
MRCERQGNIEWVQVCHEEVFGCQRDLYPQDRTADYNKNPIQATIFNKHETNGHGIDAESRRHNKWHELEEQFPHDVRWRP